MKKELIKIIGIVLGLFVGGSFILQSNINTEDRSVKGVVINGSNTTIQTGDVTYNQEQRKLYIGEVRQYGLKDNKPEQTFFITLLSTSTVSFDDNKLIKNKENFSCIYDKNKTSFGTRFMYNNKYNYITFESYCENASLGKEDFYISDK